jgi:spore coat polysaccharide biosynthesis protein SpsF
LGKIIIATTNLEVDDVIVNFAKKNEIEYFRGESDDVLDRFYQCAKNFSSDNILRITSDNPLVDPTVIDDLIINYQKSSCDYASTNLARTYPFGIDAEIFSFNTLEKTWKNAILPSEREHVSSYMKKNSKIFKQFNLRNKIKVPLVRLTIDREVDLELFRIVISKITDRPIIMNNILELYNNEPKLFEINSHMDPLEGYNKSLKYNKEFLKNKDN